MPTTSEISAFYAGSKPVDFLYVGSTEVWAAGGDVTPPPDPAFISASFVYANNQSLTAPSRPAGSGVGDGYIMAVRSNNALTTPTGWTQISSGSVSGDTRKVYGRIADGTATDLPAFGPAGHYGGVALYAFSDVHADITAGVATPNVQAGAATGTAPTTVATADGLALCIDIRSLGGTCSSVTGGTLVPESNVFTNYLCAAMTADVCAASDTVGGALFNSTAADRSVHTLVLKRADNIVFG